MGPEYTPLPSLRSRNNSLTPAILADVDCHVPDPSYWQSDDIGNWCHEGTHGVNARIRQEHGNRPGIYLGGDVAILLNHPKTTIASIAEKVPESFRGFEYQTYCVGQVDSWNDEPLYLWDEWSAYCNGAECDAMRKGTLAEYLPVALAVGLTAPLDPPTAAAMKELLTRTLTRLDRQHPYFNAICVGPDGQPYRTMLKRYGLFL